MKRIEWLEHNGRVYSKIGSDWYKPVIVGEIDIELKAVTSETIQLVPVEGINLTTAYEDMKQEEEGV